MRIAIFLLVLIAAAVAARLALFTVDRAEYAYVTQFGRPVATYDGEDEADAGLHLKWPWPMQEVQRLDHRLQYFDLPGTELLTHDRRGNTIDKTLTLDAYVCWRIAGKEGVDRFVRTVGTPDRAKAILGQRISSELGAAVGRMELDDLVSVEPGKVERERSKLRDRLLSGDSEGTGLRDLAREEYGIEIVDIRLRRANHPAAVRQEIFDRIRSERNKKVAEYQSDADKLAKEIRSAAERKKREILADARAREQEQKGLADAQADRIRSEAYRLDPQFYAFLKKLEEYQRILGDGRSVLLLSTHRELFDMLFQPPRADGKPPAGPPAPKKGGQ